MAIIKHTTIYTMVNRVTQVSGSAIYHSNYSVWLFHVLVLNSLWIKIEYMITLMNTGIHSLVTHLPKLLIKKNDI